jgi:hypothetical protein
MFKTVLVTINYGIKNTITPSVQSILTLYRLICNISALAGVKINFSVAGTLLRIRSISSLGIQLNVVTA